MPIERILIEPGQQGEVVTVRRHLLRANAQAKPDVPPPHEGLMAVVNENVQSQPGADFRQVVTSGPDPSLAAPPMPTVTSRCCIAHPPCWMARALTLDSRAGLWHKLR